MSDILKQYDDFESIECYYESSMKINEPLVQWISEAADEIARLRAERDEWQNNAVEWELDFYTAYHEITRLRAELAEARASKDSLAAIVRELNKHEQSGVEYGLGGAYLGVVAALAERDTLRQQLAVAREGLGFYANPENWKPLITRRRGQDQLSVEVDDGVFARDTLAKLEKP